MEEGIAAMHFIKTKKRLSAGMVFLALAAGSMACGTFTGLVASPTPTVMHTATFSPSPSNTCTPSLTSTPTKTATITRTPTKTHTPTLEISYTPSTTPTTVWLTIGGCADAGLASGAPVKLQGYLMVPAGSYNKNDTYHSIRLCTTQSCDVKLTLYVHSGSGPNQMYFDGRTPRIKDRYGNILAWINRQGVEVYITQRSVLIEGIVIGDCRIRALVIT
jgi:hypothetical protein